MSENCIDVRNYEAVRTIFTEKQRRLKSLKHPELREASFIERVKDTIQQPDFVYATFNK